MSAWRALLFLFPACLFLAGCPSFSVHPLYTDQDVVVEPALEGTWSRGSAGNEKLLFQKSGVSEYSLAIFSPETRVSQNYDVHLVRLGNQLFMDLIFRDQAIDGAKLADPFGSVPAHVIVKLKISGDDLAYATLEDDALQRQSLSGGAALDYQMTSGSLLVRTPTDALRSYISAHAEDAFSDFEHLQRKGEASIRGESGAISGHARTQAAPPLLSSSK
jgi:hypothetical protein